MTIVCSRCDGNHMRSECPLEPKTMTTDHEMRMYALNLFEILTAVDHTLTVHGKVDCGTPLHQRISDALAIPNEDPSGQRREPLSLGPTDDEPPFESTMEHIARDIRAGIFPRKSP